LRAIVCKILNGPLNKVGPSRSFLCVTLPALSSISYFIASTIHFFYLKRSWYTSDVLGDGGGAVIITTASGPVVVAYEVLENVDTAVEIQQTLKR
ncbi:MAG: hypothetical protein MPJ24_11650, partial [Pirellulaceae bacterium]|nr:hypothetical protein [Pirellulaceae bacterium]